MKYGRTYSEYITDVPEAWRQHALQYKELKKVINRVAAELTSLGLTSDVLSDLLSAPPTSLNGATPPPRSRSISIGKGKRKARAQYELEGPAERPEPRIRIVFSSASSASDSDADVVRPPPREASPERSSSDAYIEELSDDATSGIEEEAVTPPEELSPATALLQRLYGKGVPSPSENSPPGSPHSSHGSATPPASPSQRAKGKARAEDPVDAMLAASLILPPVMDLRSEAEEDADDEQPTPTLNKAFLHVTPPKRRKRRRHRKEILISLGEDTQFFALLGSALVSLEALELSQKAAFTQDVKSLADRVSTVSSPSRHRSDLYGWRELFGLWVEAEIFQGASELDRGEKSVSEAENRLKWFVDQVGQRQLATKMRHKDSRAALEQFVALNVQLLDLKRFQVANEMAARKILKKHDKRTALTAASDFPSFIQSLHHLEPDSQPRSLILPGFPSLPHLLLMQFTTTLLPIIPQVEDYACIICGDIAFKPIKLGCGHRFCVRCLVKMQKRGQNACPSCRAHVVLEANAANLDAALQNYLRLYFPKEVKQKQKENEKESTAEQMQEMGFDSKCCVM